MDCVPGAAGQGNGHHPGEDVLGELLSKHTLRGRMGREDPAQNAQILIRVWVLHGLPSGNTVFHHLGLAIYGWLKCLEAQSIYLLENAEGLEMEHLAKHSCFPQSCIWG